MLENARSRNGDTHALNGTDPWRPVDLALEVLSAEGRTVSLWLRDDDATEGNIHLDRLVEITARFEVPVLLAIIPGLAKPGLERVLETHHHIIPAVHGWRHRDHTETGQKPSEFGGERSRQALINDLMLARTALARQFGPRISGIFCPPWNRIAPVAITPLHQAGFSALSVVAGSPLSRAADIPQLNVHLDILDWRAQGRSRPRDRLIASIAELLHRGAAQHEPIGLLTHHKAHDAEAWRFLEALFARLAPHPAVRWQAAPDLVPEAPPRELAIAGAADPGQDAHPDTKLQRGE